MIYGTDSQLSVLSSTHYDIGGLTGFESLQMGYASVGYFINTVAKGTSADVFNTFYAYYWRKVFITDL